MIKFADSGGYTDIIIYVIIMIVGLAANFYRNASKKKAREQNDSTLPGAENEDFENQTYFKFEGPIFQEVEVSEMKDTRTFKNIFTDTPDKPVSKIEEIKEETLLPDNIYVAEEAVIQETRELLLSDKPAIIANTVEEGSNSILAELKRQDDEMLCEKEPFEFDIKNAILYSEILNPKYF